MNNRFTMVAAEVSFPEEGLVKVSGKINGDIAEGKEIYLITADRKLSRARVLSSDARSLLLDAPTLSKDTGLFALTDSFPSYGESYNDPFMFAVTLDQETAADAMPEILEHSKFLVPMVSDGTDYSLPVLSSDIHTAIPVYTDWDSLELSLEVCDPSVFESVFVLTYEEIRKSDSKTDMVINPFGPRQLLLDAEGAIVG